MDVSNRASSQCRGGVLSAEREISSTVGRVACLLGSNEKGIVRSVDGGMYLVEIDDFERCIPSSDVYLVDINESCEMANLGGYYSGKPGSQKAKRKKDLSFDIHFEKLPPYVQEHSKSKMACQMAWFHEIMSACIKYKGCHFEFIHGVGDMKLASSIREELTRHYAHQCELSLDANYLGVTRVIIR